MCLLVVPIDPFGFQGGKEPLGDNVVSEQSLGAIMLAMKSASASVERQASLAYGLPRSG
jgi:hypothetical protein